MVDDVRDRPVGWEHVSGGREAGDHEEGGEGGPHRGTSNKDTGRDPGRGRSPHREGAAGRPSQLSDNHAPEATEKGDSQTAYIRPPGATCPCRRGSAPG